MRLRSGRLPWPCRLPVPRLHEDSMPQLLSYETPTPTPLRQRMGYWLEEAGMLVVLLALVIVCAITVPNFATVQNLDSLLLAVSTVGMISCTMLFCLASGNFDLSVGTLVPCAGVMAAVVMRETSNLPPLISTVLAVGA